MNEHKDLNDVSLYSRIHALPRFKSLLSQKLVGRPLSFHLSSSFLNLLIKGYGLNYF